MWKYKTCYTRINNSIALISPIRKKLTNEPTPRSMKIEKKYIEKEDLPIKIVKIQRFGNEELASSSKIRSKILSKQEA